MQGQQIADTAGHAPLGAVLGPHEIPTYATARAEAQRLALRHPARALHLGGIAAVARVKPGPVTSFECRTQPSRNAADPGAALSSSGGCAGVTDGAGSDAAQPEGRDTVRALPSTFFTRAARDVLATWQRQVDAPGWTPAQEVGPRDCELMLEVAVSYLLKSLGDGAAQLGEAWWPEGWSLSLANPLPPRADLVRAGAVILAEIERHDHVARLGAADQTGDRP